MKYIKPLNIKKSKRYVFIKISLRIKIIIIFVLLLNLLTSNAYATSNNVDIKKKLNQNYENNAKELMSLIKHKKFNEVETFISYVVKNKHVTRDGIKYFRALLEHWFFASEVLEFRRPKPVSQDVLPYLDTWIKQNPKSAIAHIIRGVYYIELAWEIRSRGWAKDVKKKNWKTFYELHNLAKQDHEKAYKLDPSNPHSSRQLIRVQRSLNVSDTEMTEKYFQQAIKNHPTFYWAYRARLENMMPKWGGTWESMFTFATATAQNAPPKTLLPHIYAYALEEAAKRSQNMREFYNKPEVWNILESIYKQIIADFPSSAIWKLRFAKTAADADKEDVAMHYFNLAEKTESDCYKIYELKAIFYENRKQWKLEEKSARRLINLNPNFDIGYKLLGFSLIKQKRYREAIESYSNAIKHNPQKVNYWENRSYCYNKIQEYNKAIEDCTKALKMNNLDAFAYRQRGFAHEQLGNQKAAESDYKKYNNLNQK